MTRRRLLKLSLLGGLALSGGLLWGPLLGGTYPAAPGLRHLSAKEAAVLSAAAGRILDGAGADVGAVVRFADGYLGHLGPALSGDLRALLHLLEHSPVLSGRARFTALPAAEKDAVLRAWQESGLPLRRQGFHALKSLCCLAHYQDPRSFAAIGYVGPLL